MCPSGSGGAGASAALRVVYPGHKRYLLAKKVEVVPLAELVDAK
jgi:succinate dehydrogenase/fumarate reductase flavoprotein subunit